MAKDKCVEIEYKKERLRRTHIRKAKRKINQMVKIDRYGRHSESECPYCGGTMNWCSCCQMWSSNCCIDYGTCQCN